MPALLPLPDAPLEDADRRRLLLRAGRYAAAVATLSACGGGGSDAGSPGTPPGPPPPGTPPVLTTFATGLSQPWGLGFLPDGSLLVTQKGGQLRRFSSTGQALPDVSGVPAVVAAGQGGLLDIVVDPSSSIANPVIYLSYVRAAAGGQVLAVSRCLLNSNLSSMSVDEIYAMPDVIGGEIHFGGRLVWQNMAGGGGNLFVTLGDRGQLRTDLAPLTLNGTHRGKVVRIRASDGGRPADNPYTDASNGLIWSRGHRNVQGAALHPVTGELWTGEHGPYGGDEVNRTLPGASYGWPSYSHGCDYDNTTPGTDCPIGGGTHPPPHTEPLTWWGPTSIAPSGMCFYTGNRFPEWQGNLFIAALGPAGEGGRSLWRLTVSNTAVLSRRQAFGTTTDRYGSPQYGSINARLRDVKQGLDGWLYVLDESNGRILRIER
jgi:aldose sugar dehydrogenase